jgi:Tol biopolymer transport system component
LGLVIYIVLVLVLIAAPERVYARWPPFSFYLNPSYDSGKITYRIKLYRQVDWVMTHVTVKIPLPEGTRFLEASAQPTIHVDFDGSEVTFFTSDLYRSIRTASFVVEVTDPTMTVFTTHAWIAWQGDQPGDYLTRDESIDITKQPLNWEVPATSSLQLEARATVADDVITYIIYPRNVGWQRMWDLKINVPLPEGTSFLSAEAPSPFVVGFDGQVVSFSALELKRGGEVDPLSFKVSTEGVTVPFVVTHAWAGWNNVVWSGVGVEETRTGDIIVQPHASQWVASDSIGDVPFFNYDLTGIALQEDGPALKITFYTAGDLGPVGEPLVYKLYIDSDCRTDTGPWRNYRGVDGVVRYDHDGDGAAIIFWDAKTGWDRQVKLDSVVSGRIVSTWVPYDLLEDGRQFCWVGRADNVTQAFHSSPPSEWVPDGTDLRLTQYEAVTTTNATEAGTYAAEPSTGPSISGDDVSQYLPGWDDTDVPAPVPPEIPSFADISGKLAVPISNEWALYDVYVFSLPDGKEMAKVSNARQPNFRFDGQRMLINHEGGGMEDIYEYYFADGTEKWVSEAPKDSHPFYDPSGTRVVYGNPELTPHADDYRICVQCSLLPPHQEVDPRCRDVTKLGMLVSAGLRDEIWGYNPVWTADDGIAYRGCNSWARRPTSCGIYIVSSTSTRGFSEGFIPRQLTHNTSDIPSDTKGDLIAFTSHREGDWEAYVMGLDGSGVKNLSNSPDSNDGLPTISPDGNWVAFISDRSGRWAVWVSPVAGGPTQKLFDLPGDSPWGDGDRAWTNERISWGP